ncbi:MAG: Ada metal-binding domain-containing protein [Sedimentisphaerales bacterium]|jgi:hypothetical protein
MRITHLLTLAVLFFIFSSHVFAQQGLSGDVKPNPALAGIEELSVIITPADSEPNADGLKRASIKTEVIRRLYDAGFKIGHSSADASELNIKLTVLKIESIEQYVVLVRTSLVRSVTLVNGDERLSVAADIWKIDSGIRIMAAEKIVDEIPAIVKEQVQTFIAACPPMVSVEKKPDVNQPRQQLRKASVEKDAKPVKQQPVEATFVASKNSQVFHKASCSSAKRISPNNLVSYATRDEAIAAGKKPCERCNP